jgi:hypothetical protein
MMRWRCRSYRTLIVDCTDGTLSDRQQTRLQRHLARCPACAGALEGLRQVPAVLKTSAVPDPGEAFWRQQRQAIGRAIRNLPESSAHREPDWWFAGVRQRAWRYPLAATAALLLALVAYRLAERPPIPAPPDGGESAFAALDPQSLVALHELMESLLPSDDALAPTSSDDDARLAALPVEDLIGSSTLPEAPQVTDLTENELDGLGNLVGGIG